MKKMLFFACLFMALSLGNSYAQKYALIDMEYILKKIPSYENANKQLEALSQEWQKEVDTEVESVNAMYKKYQADLVFLAGNEKTKRENEIVAKENAIQELRNQYFGPQGELYKQREELIKPIQDSIYEAVKDISLESGYSIVVDRASASSIIFASPSIDISDQVLSKLGY
ncbi:MULTISPECIES: OmpH family outer membrane protein [Proteiniphilum]|jgi:outer membrane protein|uniref:OmpH family outer membrane protein n=1 Tax=Proteiniphilum TaxID=294702 RepID=UPI001EEADDC0|nr:MULTISPECIES: OmpH family outer membrane protein [Proteiniphilum]MDD2247093.1 OmpH family outer membrane protein [Proteiniphilum sp.]MDD3909118.1 OmpH family outer membrane protein [Proteiniphilum sp.]MDD4416529.1 OmpH family outer membrane protein [Proteiniphilum sp.]ULB35290.1 OmpH family outer membrane protein [Proteiniphilum propionicum]